MDKKKLVLEIIDRLKKRYPLTTALKWKNCWELLVVTVLSAQCTDQRVNQVTPVFFAKWPDPASLAKADLQEIEEVIRSTGFFRNKAKNLLATAKKLQAEHNGQVPSSMQELLALPGVARKTANIILGNCFGLQEGIAVDTHVKRIAYRLGLTKEKSPLKIEKDLMQIVPRAEWSNFNHLLVYFGRDICKARKPECAKCMLADLCPRELNG